MACATSSLPVPVSPKIRTEKLEDASAELHRLYCRAHLLIARHHDNGGFWIHIQEARKRLKTSHVGHLEIEQHHVRPLGLRALEPVLAVVSDQDGETLAREHPFEHQAQALVVTVLTAPVAFGTHDSPITNLSTALDGTGTITATCATGADVTPKVTFGRANDGQTLVATIAF